MSTLVYNRDTLKEAVVMLLDRKFGKNRTERVRMFVKGIYQNRAWFNGKRTCLRELVDMARQPTGAVKVLDLLDDIDKRRETILEEQRNSARSVFHTADVNANCTRRYYLRTTAAVLTEEIRRARVGEPPLTPETKKEFLERRKAYWRKKSQKYIQEIKSVPGCNLPHAQIIHQVADRVLKEELDKFEQAKAGVHELSDSAQRHLASKRTMWQRMHTSPESRKD